MRRYPTAFVLAATLSLMGGAAVAQQQQFDGPWSIVVSPEKGACKRTRRFQVVIDNGIIRSSDTKREGRVHEGGRIQGSVEIRKSRAEVTGSLSERSGSGTWVVSGGVNCSGRWTAEKRS